MGVSLMGMRTRIGFQRPKWHDQTNSLLWEAELAHGRNGRDSSAQNTPLPGSLQPHPPPDYSFSTIPISSPLPRGLSAIHLQAGVPVTAQGSSVSRLIQRQPVPDVPSATPAQHTDPVASLDPQQIYQTALDQAHIVGSDGA